MKVEIKEKFICCVIAIVLFFMGIGVENTTVDSSFLRSENASIASESVLYMEDYAVVEIPACTVSMLGRSAFSIGNALSTSMIRWQGRGIFISFAVISFLQYLFMYQQAEGKEDGQIFSCRSVIVDYIHLKDSGE